jgi:hypothetical protein
VPHKGFSKVEQVKRKSQSDRMKALIKQLYSRCDSLWTLPDCCVRSRKAPSTESGVTGLTTKRLDPLSMTMLAIPNQSMNVNLCDAGVETLVVRTGEALFAYPLRRSPVGFSSHARGVKAEALGRAPQPTKECRRGDRRGNHVESVA